MKRCDGVLRVLELLLHHLEVIEDRPVPGGEIGRLQHGAHLLDRHVEVAEAPDGLGGRHLIGAVVPVSAGRIDVGGFEEPDVVIVPQRLHAEVRHLRELADGEARGHVASFAPRRRVC